MQLLSNQFWGEKLFVQQLIYQELLTLILFHSCRFINNFVKENPDDIIEQIYEIQIVITLLQKQIKNNKDGGKRFFSCNIYRILPCKSD